MSSRPAAPRRPAEADGEAGAFRRSDLHVFRPVAPRRPAEADGEAGAFRRSHLLQLEGLLADPDLVAGLESGIAEGLDDADLV